MDSGEFDIIIVGAGTAGCVLAARLSEDLGTRVMLIEAGPDVVPGEEPLDIMAPSAILDGDPAYFWDDIHVQWVRNEIVRGRPLGWYRQARVLGGKTAIDSAAAMRAMPMDFDEWQRLGLHRWRWPDVLPYYRHLETDQDFEGPYHGSHGPIHIRRHAIEAWPPFCRAVAKSMRQQGAEVIEDMNSQFDDGILSLPMSSDGEHRISVASGYLPDSVRRRANLRIFTNATARRLRFRGLHVTGVETTRGMFMAKRVILAAGAINTPTLLMRSGVGSQSHLSLSGVKVVADLPGVGENLQDHATVSIGAHLRRGAVQSHDMLSPLNVGLRYSSGFEGCPDSDMMMTIYNRCAWQGLGHRLGRLEIALMKPFSRGAVRLSRKAPQGPPDITLNMFDDPMDLDRIMEAVRFGHELLSSSTVAPTIKQYFAFTSNRRLQTYLNGKIDGTHRGRLMSMLLDMPGLVAKRALKRLLDPVAPLDQLVNDDPELRRWILFNATTLQHPVGTCRLGTSHDPLSVVNEVGQVYKISGVHVVDSSIMPTIPRADPNLTVMMIAEKVADDIRRGRAG